MQGNGSLWKKHKMKIIAGVIGAGVLGAGYVYSQRYSFAPDTGNDTNSTVITEPSHHKTELFETLGIFDSVIGHVENTHESGYGVSFPNSLGITDGVSVAAHKNIYLDEHLGIKDSYSDKADFKKSLTENIGIYSDAQASKSISLFENFGMSDSYSHTKATSLNLYENLGIANLMQKYGYFNVNLEENLGVYDNSTATP